MKGIRSALTDDSGAYDIAYVSLGGVMAAVFGSIVVMCTVSTLAYFRCQVFTVNEVIVNCLYDPQPLGTAIGFACGGFATALGALSAYMLATRSPRQPATTTTTTSTSTTEVAAAGPLQVDVVNMPPPDKPKPKVPQPKKVR